MKISFVRHVNDLFYEVQQWTQVSAMKSQTPKRKNKDEVIPRRRGSGKGAEARSEVRERASACPVSSRSQTASTIFSHTAANPWRPYSHFQDYPWSLGIPYGIYLRTSNPQRSTRPRQKFHQQRCCRPRRQFTFTIWAVPFWNKLPAETVNASSVKAFKTLLDAHWQSLFPEVPI